MTRPEIPACWSWEVPAFPQPNHGGVLTAWQAGRCAICGEVPPVLFEDHDHATGDTRGYLCPSCNVAEGYGRHAVFLRYRERPPVAILGLLLRYGAGTHPEVRNAVLRWENTLSNLSIYAREVERHVTSCEVAAIFGTPPPPPPELRVTPLTMAAERVGITWKEWEESISYRLDCEWDKRRGDTPRPHPLRERLRIRAMFAEDAA